MVYNRDTIKKKVNLTLRNGSLVAAGASQASIMSKVKRRNFLSPKQSFECVERLSALRQQYSRKFLAYRDGCLIVSEASELKFS